MMLLHKRPRILVFPEVHDRPGPAAIRDVEHLEELLLGGLYSGTAIEATPELWEQKRVKLIELYNQKPQPL